VAPWVAAALEEGRFRNQLTSTLMGAVAAGARGLGGGDALARRMAVRRLALPPGAGIVAVGGATLGGSGKTPLAIACARELLAAGRRVAFVGHAYRARPARARVVAEDDPIDEVGDEALLAARALGGWGVPVIVAPSRAAALALAALHADTLVLDGVGQTAPVRADLALLAVDASAPWGAGALPPLGDLRAPPAALLDACDGIVTVGDPPAPGAAAFSDGTGRETWAARPVSAGAWVGGELRTWADLGGARVGLLSVLARPHRLVRALAARGVRVRALVRASNHGPLDRGFFARAAREAGRERIDLWLASAKCAIHFEPETRRIAGEPDRAGSALAGHVGRHAALDAPVGVLDHELVLCAELRERLARFAERGAPPRADATSVLEMTRCRLRPSRLDPRARGQ